MLMANVHCAAAIRSFVAQESHSLDIPFWKDLVTSMPDLVMVDGYVAVPEEPGLGIELHLEAIEEHLRYPGLFAPTEEWNDPKLGWWIPPEQRALGKWQIFPAAEERWLPRSGRCSLT